MSLTRIPLALAFLAAFALPGDALAGTLCGTVRDAFTGAPVAGAGVFLRTPAGAPTGLDGGTAVDGTFCIADVPAGTYDLEVRHDDYLVAYLRGVVVTEGAVDVEVPASASIALAAPVPNPARGPVRITWTLPLASSVTLRVHDVSGRLVRGWSGVAAAGTSTMTWDFRDGEGRLLPAGVYALRLEAAGVVRTRRVVRVP